MGMVIKTEPAFTWLYFCNKSLRGQWPQYCLRGMWANPLAPPVRAHCSILNSFPPKKTSRWLTNTWKDAHHHSLSDKCKPKPQGGTTWLWSGWLLYKNLQAINAGEGVEKGTLLHCWWECKLAQPLWRTLWRFLKKLELELPYDPTIPLLGKHTEETRLERDMCTRRIITALFTIARPWKQPRCPSADEWIRKLWYIYTGVLLSH